MKRHDRQRQLARLTAICCGLMVGFATITVTAQEEKNEEAADVAYRAVWVAGNIDAKDDEQNELRSRLDKIDAQIQKLIAEKQSLESELASESGVYLDTVVAASNLRTRADYLDSLAQYSALVRYYDEETESQASEWIGVHSVSVPSDVRDYLELDEGVGILVEQVIEGSPAEDAELQRRDVIVAVDDSSISSVEDLVEAIQARENDALILHLIRRGTKMDVEVTPQPRPDEPLAVANVWNFEASKNLDTYYAPYNFSPSAYGRLLLEAQTNSEAAKLILDPAQIEYLSAIPMPASVTISISQSGDSDALLIVQRDDEKQEVALSELATLATDQQLYAIAFLCRANRLASLLPENGEYLRSGTYIPTQRYQWAQPTYGEFHYDPAMYNWRYSLDLTGVVEPTSDEEEGEDTEPNKVSLEELERQLLKAQQLLRDLKDADK